MFSFVLWTALLLWASAFAGIRSGLKEYNPFHLALLRFCVASLTLLMIAPFQNIRKPAVQDCPRLFLLGLFGISIYHTLLNWGEMTVSAASASFIINTAPAMIAIISVFFLKEQIRPMGWLGMGISFLGVTVIALGEGKGLTFEKGGWLILGSALCTSLYTVWQKPLLKKYSAFEVTLYSIVSGTMFLLVFSPGLFQTIRNASLLATCSVVYLGIGPAALAYFGYSYLLSHRPASQVASYLYLVPVLSIGVAYIWLNELPGWISLTGSALALGGILLITWAKHFKEYSEFRLHR
jgi:drug/metabolite transporter (DMT)-like permease